MFDSSEKTDQSFVFSHSRCWMLAETSRVERRGKGGFGDPFTYHHYLKLGEAPEICCPRCLTPMRFVRVIPTAEALSALVAVRCDACDVEKTENESIVAASGQRCLEGREKTLSDSWQ
jgi:hypothetical protein